MKPLKPFIFAILALLYLWFPWSLIRYQEKILQQGTYYLFESQDQRPLYLLGRNTLHIEWENRLPGKQKFSYREKIYLGIAKDARGIAHFDSIYKSPPANSRYLTTSPAFGKPNWAYFRIPEQLQTYHLDKRQIPFVSGNLQNAIQSGRLDSLQIKLQTGIRVRKGEAIIEKVLLNGLPAETFILDLEEKYGKNLRQTEK